MARWPAIEGWRWVKFVGGSADGREILMKEPVQQGDTYERLVTEEVYVYQAEIERYVLR